MAVITNGIILTTNCFALGGIFTFCFKYTINISFSQIIYCFFSVGQVGIEPTTPSLSETCADQLRHCPKTRTPKRIRTDISKLRALRTTLIRLGHIGNCIMNLSSLPTMGFSAFPHTLTNVHNPQMNCPNLAGLCRMVSITIKPIKRCLFFIQFGNTLWQNVWSISRVAGRGLEPLLPP